MAENAPTQAKSGGGCVAKLIVLFLLVCAAGLGAAAFFIAQPQDLDDVGGNSPASRNPTARDLKVVLRNALDRNFQVTLTESEINQWLGRVLSTRQGGALAGQVSLDRVWVRLLDGHAEVILERRVMGRPFTVSMFVTVEQIQSAKGVITEIQLHGGPYHPNLPKPPRGGRFGRLVVPQGFLLLVKPAFDKLAPLFEEELRLAFEEMARIRIEKNRLVLDPTEPESGALGLPKTF